MYLHNRVYLFLNSDRAYPKFHVCIVYTKCMYLGMSSYFNLPNFLSTQTNRTNSANTFLDIKIDWKKHFFTESEMGRRGSWKAAKASFAKEL